MSVLKRPGFYSRFNTFRKNLEVLEIQPMTILLSARQTYALNLRKNVDKMGLNINKEKINNIIKDKNKQT